MSALSSPKAAGDSSTIKPRRSKATRLAAEIGRLSRKKPDWKELVGPVDAFFEANRETIIRAAMPDLKPDGKGGFSVLRACPKTGKLHRVDIAGDFSTWSIDGDARSAGVYQLLAELNRESFGSDAGLLLLVGACCRVLLPRELSP